MERLRLKQDSVLFSVVIPVYNIENYVQQCLDSVIEQENENIEIVIVDDGSTDQSRQICMQYAEINPVVKYVRQKNAGLGAARNTGLMKACGKYVIFLDSDDYWNRNCIEKMQDCISKYPYLDIVYFDSDVIYENQITERNEAYDLQMYNRKGKMKEKIFQGVEFFNETYPRHFNVSACMAVYRRKFLLENRILFPQNVLYEDNPFSLQAVLKAFYVKYLPEKLYVRRYRASSIMTRDINHESLRSSAQIFNLVMDYVDREQEQYEEIVLRKMKNFAFDLAHAFWLKCSVYCDKSSIMLQTKEKIYKRVYDSVSKKEKKDLWLEEWVILIHLTDYLVKDKEMEGVCEYIKGREEISSLDELISKYKKEYSLKVKEKIRKQFQYYSNKKLGIYGKGNHTVQLLKTLDRLKIMPKKLFLIDSTVVSGTQEMQGLSVLNIKDVPEDTEIVVISSYLYEQEMYETAVQYLPKHLKIEKIYSDEIREICWEWLCDV